MLCVYGGWSFLRRATGYWNIAVFGVDSRDGNTKNALADVQLICSINQETGEIKLVSVYRDTYLKINSKGTYHKINEAYFKGGHKQAVSALEENLDVKINDYATFNWKAVAQAINVLGGVDIEITQPEFKYINAFITETVNSTGIGSTQLASAGPNHLDGVQAVAYCRLRLMDTDFQRTERQRKVISLALEKAKQADLATRTNLVKAILPQISTSVGVDDVLPMAKNASKYHIGETAGFPFAQKTKKMGKMDCVIPVTLESNVVTLHQFLYGEDAIYSPSSTVKKSVIILLKNQVFMKVVRRLRLLPVPENQTARASHPEQVKIMLRPRLLHKQQLKKVLKQKKQQRRPAIQRIKQQQKRVQQLLLKNWTTPKQRKKLPAHRKAAQVL